MEEMTTCPDCSEALTMTHIGGEPPRRVCGRFGCDFEGVTLA